MDLNARKNQLESEIIIAKRMIKRNATNFKPTSYLLPSNSNLKAIVTKLFDNPIETTTDQLPGIDASGLKQGKFGWVSHFIKIFFKYL